MDARVAFGIVTSVGGVTTLLTYAWLVLVATDRDAVVDLGGGLLRTPFRQTVWATSMVLATLSILTALSLTIFDESVEIVDWKMTHWALVAFFVSTASWVPTTYVISKHRVSHPLVRGLALVPVWATFLSNLFLVIGSRGAVQALWCVGAVHHFLLDALFWSWGYVTAEPIGYEKVLPRVSSQLGGL